MWIPMMAAAAQHDRVVLSPRRLQQQQQHSPSPDRDRHGRRTYLHMVPILPPTDPVVSAYFRVKCFFHRTQFVLNCELEPSIVGGFPIYILSLKIYLVLSPNTNTLFMRSLSYKIHTYQVACPVRFKIKILVEIIIITVLLHFGFLT